MVKKVQSFWVENKWLLLIAFLIPTLVMIAVYAHLDIYWGSERTVLASDAFSQFANFHASFRYVLTGEQSIFYTWSTALGLNYWAFSAYYLGGLFTPVVLFFPLASMPDVLYVLTVVKIGCAGVAFFIYAHRTFKISPWLMIGLSTAYSLMSFITALSELVMWLDTFIFLPFIILGVNRLLEKGKPTCLFISYLCLFMANFYMGFMVGLFSLLYFLARIAIDWKVYKKCIIPYCITSFLAGIASLVVVLPVVLDLRTNGEDLTKIKTLKTAATNVWDVVIKNMVGVYDTTKYDSIPFIYIGLIPLIFCLFYFVTPKIARKNKINYGLLAAILIASFYLEPLNLFWQGMHTPNMFLFRFSFVFSFLVIMLAGYGLESYTTEEKKYLLGTVGSLFILMAASQFFITTVQYAYVSDFSYYATLLFVGIYFIFMWQVPFLSISRVVLLLLVVMVGEAVLNTNGMLNGISTDWGYAERVRFSGAVPFYGEMVEKAKEEQPDRFYRLESISPVTPNDGLSYHYNGISSFSSIRNRNTLQVLNELGFRSNGSNLHIRYPNNTLLMDSLFDIEYLITDNRNPQKYGFDEVTHNEHYGLYQNKNALPLGFLVPKKVLETELPLSNNLTSQNNLFNGLAETQFQFYDVSFPEVVSTRDMTVEYEDVTATFIAEREFPLADEVEKPVVGVPQKKKQKELQDVTWHVEIPAGKQAYMYLIPLDFSQFDSQYISWELDGRPFKTRIEHTGQLYNLGYFEKEKSYDATFTFEGTSEEMTFIRPALVVLDLKDFQEAVDHIQDRTADLTVNKRRVTGNIQVEAEDELLFTTIPYDKGWSAKVDGKRVEIEPFHGAFVTIPLSKGKHKIELVFLPAGFQLGATCFIGSILLFSWLQYSKKKKLGRNKT